MDALDLVRRLLHREDLFAAAVTAEIRELGAEKVIESICETVDMRPANAAEVLLWAIESADAADVEGALRRVMEEASG